MRAWGPKEEADVVLCCYVMRCCSVPCCWRLYRVVNLGILARLLMLLLVL